MMCSMLCCETCPTTCKQPEDPSQPQNSCQASVELQDQEETGKVEGGGEGTGQTSCPGDDADVMHGLL